MIIAYNQRVHSLCAIYKKAIGLQNTLWVQNRLRPQSSLWLLHREQIDLTADLTDSGFYAISDFVERIT